MLELNDYIRLGIKLRQERKGERLRDGGASRLDWGPGAPKKTCCCEDAYPVAAEVATIVSLAMSDADRFGGKLQHFSSGA